MINKNYIGIVLLMFIWSCNSNDTNHRNNNESDYLGNNEFYQNQLDSLHVVEDYLSNTNFDKLLQKYEDPERHDWQNPELVLDKLGDLSGKVVADLGAGSGYFTFRMAQTAKEIIAIDIDPRFLDYINDRKQELPRNISDKIVTRLTIESDPSLEEDEVDVVLVVNTFHYIQNRSEYFSKVKNGLKKDGYLVIVDFKNTEMPIAPPEELLVAPEMAFMELRNAGFTEFTIDEKSLEYQYIIIAK